MKMQNKQGQEINYNAAQKGGQTVYIIKALSGQDIPDRDRRPHKSRTFKQLAQAENGSNGTDTGAADTTDARRSLTPGASPKREITTSEADAGKRFVNKESPRENPGGNFLGRYDAPSFHRLATVPRLRGKVPPADVPNNARLCAIGRA